MSDRVYYVRCKTGCLAEGLTKEQTLTAIEQAIRTGEITDVDTGFITRLKEQNKGEAFTVWTGTAAEFNAITTKIDGCLYIITDDTTQEDTAKEIETLKKEVAILNEYKQIAPQIIVNASGDGIVSCTDENGRMIAGSEKDGVWIFSVPNYGKYILSSSNLSVGTQTINISAVQQHNIALTSYASRFEDNSWEHIIEAVQRNSVPDSWSVGSTKNMKLSNGKTYRVQIIGKNHDTYVGGTKAPLTFAFGDHIGTDIMNGNGTNDWVNSQMRLTTLPNIMSEFDTTIQEAIKPVIKLTSAGNEQNTLVESHDKLFLLSEVEMFGGVTYSLEGEGTGYGINGLFQNYAWMRSPQIDSPYCFVYNYDGRPRCHSAAEKHFIYPAFCF